MIAASEPQEFVPRGRRQFARHPGASASAPPPPPPPAPPPAVSVANVVSTATHQLQKRLSRVAISDDPATPTSATAAAATSTPPPAARGDSPMPPATPAPLPPPKGDAGSGPDAVAMPPPPPPPHPPPALSALPPLSVGGASAGAGAGWGGGPEQWRVRGALGAEEELYACGRTAVWSRGGASHAADKVVVCCYSADTPVQHALWCTFHSTTSSLSADLEAEAALANASLATAVAASERLGQSATVLGPPPPPPPPAVVPRTAPLDLTKFKKLDSLVGGSPWLPGDVRHHVAAALHSRGDPSCGNDRC